MFKKDFKKDEPKEGFVKIPVFGISQEELATGSVGDEQLQDINGKRIKAGTIYGEQLVAGQITAKQIVSNALIADTLYIPNRFQGSTIVFSVSGKVVSWTAGVIYLKKRVWGNTLEDITYENITITVAAGSLDISTTGDLYFYIEWTADDNYEPNTESKTMQHSTTYPTLPNDVPLIFAWYDSTLLMAQFRSIQTNQGVIISGGSILANSITANQIKAGTITTDKLYFTPYVIGTNNLDDITNGTTYKRVKSAAIDANGMVLLDQAIEGTYGKVKAAAIDANGMVLLDQIIDGTTYKKVASTEISAGHLRIYSSTSFDYNYDPTTKVPGGGAAADVNANTTTIDGGKITTGSITATSACIASLDASKISTGTITAVDLETATYNQEKIRIQASASYLPEIQFFYAGNVQHEMYEAAGTLYIQSNYGGDIHINAASPYSVYFDSSIHVQNAINLSTAVSLSQTTYDTNNYLESTLGILLPSNRGIKFNDIYTGGSLWFDTGSNTFKYTDTNGNTKTIATV